METAYNASPAGSIAIMRFYKTTPILKYFHYVLQIQFTILMLHFGVPLVGGYCDFPKTLLFIGFTQNMFMFTLFADFYIKTYIKKK